jgi:hypothetical protein
VKVEKHWNGMKMEGTLQNKGFKGEGNLALGLGIPNKDNYLIF